MGKRIAVISHSAGNGGAERVATLVANNFVKEGHDVSFYAIHSDLREYYLDEKVKYEYCDVKQSGVAGQFLRSVKLAQWIKKNRIEVMVSLVYNEGIFLVGNRSLKKIYSLRNDPTKFYNSGINKLLRNKVYADADYVVFQTPDARDYFGDDVKEHGILIANPLKEGLPYWNQENYKKEIVVACRINKQKNLFMLLEAFKKVCEVRDDYKLAIYGEGELKEVLISFADSLGIGELVEFRGYTNEIHSIMANSAIYVSSSDYEGISNSMIEALAIGIPSVCTDCPVGGARMFIKNGESGFLTPVGDSEAMAEKLLLLMDSEELKIKFSTESRKIREELSEEKIYSKWNELVL